MSDACPVCKKLVDTYCEHTIHTNMIVMYWAAFEESWEAFTEVIDWEWQSTYIRGHGFVSPDRIEKLLLLK